jgi:hypothetical protein
MHRIYQLARCLIRFGPANIRYEVAECIRRLSLTAFLSVYQTGKTQQTVAAILLSVIAIFIFDHCKCEVRSFCF